MADKTYVIKIEGQEIPVPAEIGGDDAKVRAALAPFFPDAANAMITRKEEGDQVTVTVIKKAGSKGGTYPPATSLKGRGEVVEMLRGAKGGQNPAVALFLQMGEYEDMDPVTLLEMGPRIEKALKDGQEQGERLGRTLAALRMAPAQASSLVPVGF